MAERKDKLFRMDRPQLKSRTSRINYEGAAVFGLLAQFISLANEIFPSANDLADLKKKERRPSEPADGERGKKRRTCGKRGTQIRLLVICYLFFLLFSLSGDTPTT